MEIRKLTETEYDSFLQHLLTLSFADRHNRFSGAVADDSVKMYVNGINKNQDEVWVIKENENIIGAAHIGIINSIGEIGISVDEKFRGKGVGSKLLDHCFERCKNLGLKKAMTICATKNRGMVQLSKKMKMKLEIDFTDVFAEHCF